MKKIIAMLFISCKLIFAADFGYVLQDVDNADILLYKGSKIEVMDSSKVMLKAFVNTKNELFSDKNFTFKIGKLNNKLLVNKANQYVFKLEKSKFSKDPLESWEEYEELYYEACTQCHSAHEPDEHTMIEWEGIYSSMAEQSQLDKEIGEKVLRYLKSHAKDGFVTP